jgi:hypothetical protein
VFADILNAVDRKFNSWYKRVTTERLTPSS